MQLLLSKKTKVHRAKTGHGTISGRIQINALELEKIIGKNVQIEIYIDERRLKHDILYPLKC